MFSDCLYLQPLGDTGCPDVDVISTEGWQDSRHNDLALHVGGQEVCQVHAALLSLSVHLKKRSKIVLPSQLKGKLILVKTVRLTVYNLAMF